MDLDAALRAHGCRVTRPRQLVWDVLASSDRHLGATEITDRVQARDSGVNSSSVYRALALFGELDLVRESRLGDEASTWEPTHADSVIHIVCTRCGSVRHYDTDIIDKLAGQLLTRGGFRAQAIDVRATGLCRDCDRG